MSFDALEEPWVPVWFCMGQTNESGLAVLGIPSGPSFSSHCKVFHRNNFYYNQCLGFICLSLVMFSFISCSSCALCWSLWESKTTAFLDSGIFILFHPFLFTCDYFLVSLWLHFPGGFLFVAVLWRINPRIFCFSFFLPKRMALSILFVLIATELCVKLALEHLLKVIL